MDKLTVIFVSGDSEVDKIIDEVSHGPISHVAIKILGSVLEAEGIKDPTDKFPGVWLHPLDKYDNDPHAIFIDIDIPYLIDAEGEARRLLATPYGYIDCIRGGIHDLTGIDIRGNTITANCSETVTRILRSGCFSILPDVPPDDVTPNDIYRVLTANV